MKIALGTVQFGTSYGAFNTEGQVSRRVVTEILDLAESLGVETLDTARAYGSSEQVLGDLDAANRFEIVTKCPALNDCEDPGAALLNAFEQSCKALDATGLYGYLLHDSSDLEKPGVWDALKSLQDNGYVKRVGVSGYNVDEIVSLCLKYPLTLAQLPANVLSPWFVDSALPQRVEIHVRSVFLQGFLLCDPDQLPPRFIPWRETLLLFRSRAAKNGLSPLEAALAPLLTCSRIARLIVGVDSVSQAKGTLSAVRSLENLRAVSLGEFPAASTQLTDPRCW